MLLVLLWAETCTPPCAVQAPRPAREKQEAKWAGEVVCVSPLNAAQAQSARSSTLHPKPELVQKIAAVGAA